MDKIVLIPTVGRSSLLDLVSAIQKDLDYSDIKARIVIALNGEMEVSLDTLNVEVLKISEFPIGVGATVNRALKFFDRHFVWTIADDEEWLLGKFMKDLKYLSQIEKGAILFPKILYKDQFGETIRPIIPKNVDISIAKYLFGNRHFLRNKNFITMSGAFALAETWRKIPFSESMSTREDIDYLIKQEASGTSFLQSDSVTVVANIDLARGVIRETNFDETFDWIYVNLVRRQQLNFLVSIWPKPIASQSNFRMLIDMYKYILKKLEPKVNFSEGLEISLSYLYWLLIASVCKFNLLGALKIMGRTDSD